MKTALPPAEYEQLVNQMRTAQRAYWRFTGENRMKRRLLEFALNLEAEVDQSTIFSPGANVSTRYEDPLIPSGISFTADRWPTWPPAAPERIQ
jgi:hypothetical protein